MYYFGILRNIFGGHLFIIHKKCLNIPLSHEELCGVFPPTLCLATMDHVGRSVKFICIFNAFNRSRPASRSGPVAAASNLSAAEPPWKIYPEQVMHPGLSVEFGSRTPKYHTSVRHPQVGTCGSRRKAIKVCSLE